MEDDLKSKTATTRASLMMVEERRNLQRTNAKRRADIHRSLVVKARWTAWWWRARIATRRAGVLLGMSLRSTRGDNVNLAAVADVSTSHRWKSVARQWRGARHLAVGQSAVVLSDAVPVWKLRPRSRPLALASRSNDRSVHSASSI